MNDGLEEFIPRIYRFALRLSGDVHLAEDITQETFVRCWRARRKLRRAGSLEVWLFRTAHNLWRDHMRREAVRRRHRETVEAERASLDGSAAASGDERIRIVAEAIESLPARQREVLHLVACESLPLEAVAAVLGISRKAARASLSLARQRVREYVQRRSPEVPVK